MAEARVWMSRDLCVSGEVSHFAKLVYALMRLYGWDSGEFFGARERLSEDFACSLSTIDRALAELLNAGLLAKTASPGSTNSFRFPRHPLAADGESEKPALKPKRVPKPKPSQPELPGVPPPPAPPPPTRSRELKAYDYFDARRRDRLGDLYAPEKKLVSAAWITVVFVDIYAVLHEPSRVCELVDLYFVEDWPAKLEDAYCFAAFAKHWREKWLPKVLGAVAA